MFGNIIFGFIDNAGLFFGGVYLEEIFAMLPGGFDANVTAGYGNTFSDTLGIFLGTFCGTIIENITGVDSGPMWANAFGIIVGCLLGILIPKLILSNSSTTGLNKITSRQVLLGSMDTDELKAMISGEPMIHFRARRAFKLMDYDKSG